MALTQNQLDDIFQTQLGRAPTDYEVQKFGNASTQVLSSLGSIYKGYSQLTVPGYLAYTGQDPATASTLAQGYGIQNYDPNTATDDVNSQFLQYLKSPPSQPSGDASGGSIGAAAGGSNEPDYNAADAGQQPASTPGSISSAAGTPAAAGSPPGVYQPPAPDPALATTLQSYQSVQSQIADIDNALANLLNTKKAQITQAGGIVDEAQLMGEIQTEQAPLVAQRQQLATQQATLGKTYQQMLAAQKDAEAQAYEQWQSQNTIYNDQQKQQSQTFTQGLDTAKLGETESKDTSTADYQQGQLALKAAGLDASEWKTQKVNVYDQYGNVAGQQLVATNASTGEQRILSSGGSGTSSGGAGDTSAPSTPGSISTAATPGGSAATATSPSDLTSPTYLKSFISNADAPSDSNSSLTVPGTNLTVGAIYQDALEYIATNKMPTGGRGTKSIILATQAAIQNKAAQLLQKSGISMPQYQQVYKANGTAISQVTDRLARIDTINASLTTQFTRLEALASQVDPKVLGSINESDISASTAQIEAKFGSTPAAQYVEFLQAMRSEYGAFIAAMGGGRGGGYAFASASDAIPAGYTADQYVGVQQNLAYTLNSTRTAAQGEIQDLMGGENVGNGAGGSSTSGAAGSQNTPVSAGSTITYQGKQYSVDANGDMTPL
jgi:hypothetical protein